jgi:Mg-chelatase subunit ChlI
MAVTGITAPLDASADLIGTIDCSPDFNNKPSCFQSGILIGSCVGTADN